MTKEQIKDLIRNVDPAARHYFADGGGQGCTVWMETERTGLDANNGAAEKGWRFSVMRYTKDEEDDMPQRIEDALESDVRVSVSSYRVDYDVNTGYIVHSFECGAV